MQGMNIPDLPVLQYGQTARYSGFSCTSATDGVTCTHDATGGNFVIRRAGVLLDGVPAPTEG